MHFFVFLVGCILLALGNLCHYNDDETAQEAVAEDSEQEPLADDHVAEEGALGDEIWITWIARPCRQEISKADLACMTIADPMQVNEVPEPCNRG